MQTCAIAHCSRVAQSERGGALCASHYFIQWNGGDPKAVTLREQHHAPCLTEGCDRLATSNSLCVRHNRSARQGITPIPPGSKLKLNPPCSFEGCALRSASRKNPLCHTHESQMRSRGWMSPRKPTSNSLHPMTDNDYGPCAHEGCERKSKFDSIYCSGHNGQFVSHGSTWDFHVNISKKDAVCIFPGCEEMADSRNPGCHLHLRRASRHGITIFALAEMFTDAHCAACGATEGLVVDHDHNCCASNRKKNCGKCIRGVLCSVCNLALGRLGDDPTRIAGLLAYARAMPHYGPIALAA